MVRVDLKFRTQPLVWPDFAHRWIHFIRLMAGVQFVLPSGTLTKTHDAIFDTGAPWCILPRSIWSPLEVQIHTPDTSFGGISRRKVCQVKASAGTVWGRLVDDAGHATRIYAFPAYLAKGDRVPLIVGFADLLEGFDTYFSPGTGVAWIEEP